MQTIQDLTLANKTVHCTVYNNVKDQTRQYKTILWISGPLIETGKFCGCQDGDQSSVGKSCGDGD